MTKEEKLAREMAERCAKQVTECRYLDLRDMTITTNAEIILRELNLVALLESQAELKRLEGEILELAFQLAQRDLTNAMKQEEGK